MWQLKPESDYVKKSDRFLKKHRRELAAVLNNLDTFYKALCEGSKPQQVKVGFVHPEPHGVLAIDQKGGGSSLKAIRLYVFPDESTRTLYLITMGGKESQRQDIKYCGEWMADFRKGRE
jgi:hypothetical protein